MRVPPKVGFSIALLVLGGVAIESYNTTRTVVATAARVAESHEVIEKLGDLEAALAHAESARRGHGLTRNEGELVAYDSALGELDATRSRLRALTDDSPDQRGRWNRLDDLIRKRIAMLQAGIAARRERAEDTEGEQRRTREGSVATAEIDSLLTAMVAAERDQLARREAETSASVDFTRLVQIAGTALSFGILLFGFRGLEREIASRARSERALRESETNVTTTLRSLGDGVVATDLDGRIETMNPVAETLSGWALEDAKGKPFGEVFRMFDEMSRERTIDPVEHVLRDSEAIDIANYAWLIAKDGAERPIANRAAPIRDDSGGVKGVVLVLRDMTAERAAKERVEDANRFLDSIVENIPNMIFVKGASGLRFERLNRAGEMLLGVSRDKLLGKSDLDLFPSEQAEAFVAKDREVLSGKNVVTIAEEPIATPAGTRWLHTKKIPILDADQRPKYLLGISEDITERKELLEQLQRAHDDLERKVEERTAELRKTNESFQREIRDREKAEATLRVSEEQLRQVQKMESIGRLAGGVAHDFNNLLSVVLSYTALLSEDLAQDDPVRADLMEIRRAGERATDLTRQLLAFSRQQVLAVKIVDLNDVIQGMKKMLARMIGEDIEIRTAAAPRLGKVKVDPGQMEQIIMNLVVNARDAMPDGGAVTIETANVQLDADYTTAHGGVTPGPHVMLAVTDSGTGMDQATRERIFEPFFTTKERGKGTGLGLATVFGIVKQSGGYIWVYSEPGKGTAFKVYLPRATEDGVLEQPAELSASRAPGQGSETILLVEDDEQVRLLARNVLTRSGYQVIDAANGEEALLLCQRFSGEIHLIITDLVMPKMSGREVANRLTTLRPDARVLFMSGYTDDVVLRSGALEDGFAFLQKPLTPEVLRARVRDILDGPASGIPRVARPV